MSEETKTYPAAEVDSIVADTLQELELSAEQCVKLANENEALKTEVDDLKTKLKSAKQEKAVELEKVAHAPGLSEEVVSGIVSCLQDASLLTSEKSAGLSDLLRKDASQVVATIQEAIKLSTPRPRSGSGVAKQASAVVDDDVGDASPWQDVVDNGVR